MTALVAFGAVVSLVLGLLATGVVRGLTRMRHRVLLARGRVELALEYGTGIVGGPLLLLAGTMGPHFEEEVMLLGPALAMPASTTIVWLTGEVLTGASRRGGWSLIGAFLAAQAGFVAGAVLSALAGRAVLGKAGGTLMIDASIHFATLLIPFVAGGVASAWAYRRLRSGVVVKA